MSCSCWDEACILSEGQPLLKHEHGLIPLFAAEPVIHTPSKATAAEPAPRFRKQPSVEELVQTNMAALQESAAELMSICHHHAGEPLHFIHTHKTISHLLASGAEQAARLMLSAL